jgi:Oxidoreductase NAD-binding domain
VGRPLIPHQRADPPGRRLLRWDEVICRDELERLRDDGLTVVHALTRSQPPGWMGDVRRVDAEMLDEVSPGPAALLHAYVCGPTEASSDRPSSLLVVPTSLVKTSTTDGPQLVLGS